MTLLAKLNVYLRKIVFPLNIFNIIVGLVMGIAYVYIPFTSIIGLLLGIATAISGSATMGISYYFTAKNTQPSDEKKKNAETETTQYKDNIGSTLFLIAFLPMIFLNSAASFFGMYTGILLLAGALGAPIAPAAIIVISILLASVLAGGTLINSWLQTHHIWKSFKTPVVITTKSNPITPSPALVKNPQKVTPEPLAKIHRQAITQRVSQYIGSFFSFTIVHKKTAPLLQSVVHHEPLSAPQRRHSI